MRAHRSATLASRTSPRSGAAPSCSGGGARTWLPDSPRWGRAPRARTGGLQTGGATGTSPRSSAPPRRADGRCGPDRGARPRRARRQRDPRSAGARPLRLCCRAQMAEDERTASAPPGARGRTLLVTGGAGFIGSNFVAAHLAQRPHDRVIVLDALTYAGRLESLPPEVRSSDRFEFLHGNVRSQIVVESLVQRGDAIEEGHPLQPHTPYAAAKCGADRLVHASAVTYELPAVILRPFNNYGPSQHLEKLVPRLVTSALLGEPLTVHGDGSSSRDWIHVRDTCRAVEAVLDAPLEAVRGEVFNVATGRSTDVLSIARQVLALTGRCETDLVHTPDRPGQVKRQRSAVDKAAERLGFRAEIGLERGLAETVDWYRSHRDWWEGLRWMRSVPVLGSDGRVTYW